MIPLLVRSSAAIIIAILVARGHAANLPDDPIGRAMMQDAQSAITSYHAGSEASDAKLRVVYFHPSDRAPLPGYAERLDRALTNVSNFYRDGLQRFGIRSEGLPLEKKDGRLVLHIVKGKLPASGYKHESGNQTAREIYEALKGTVELGREHVLVLYGLCRKEPDGRYVFDAPYYGGGSHSQGLCHAADCELLDPELLTNTSEKIVYTEHYYPRLEQSVAKFNSMYLGGIAHELGHGLGLPHDSASREEAAFGPSIMGSGNLYYRQEVWGGGPPVFLSRASALQFASHPLVTGSNRGRWNSHGGEFEKLKFAVEGGALQIEGKAVGKIPPYGVIAYVWPTSLKTDHQARTYPVVLKDGTFSLNLSGLRPNSYRLKLTALHVNGATTTHEYGLSFNDDGLPDADALNDAWHTGRAEKAVTRGSSKARGLLTDEIIAAAPTAGAKRKLQVLRAILDPAPPVDLSSVEGDNVFLSDAIWTEAKVGWGQVARNHNWFDARIQNGAFLTLRGQFYDKGLYAHAPSRYAYPLGGKWKKFTATIGLRDGAHAQGSAIFTVRGDGKELYRSPVLRVGSKEQVEVDISSVNQLELVADGGEGHTHNSWAIWAEPKVAR